MKKYLSNTLLVLVAIILILFIKGFWQLKDRHPNISDEINVVDVEGHIFVGAAALPIVPAYYETWKDLNNNAIYDADIDAFNDANNNGKFDAIWLAGFKSPRPMLAVHDSIWASSMVVEVDGKNIGFLSLDIIGLVNDHCWKIRKLVKEKTGIDQLYVVSTHSHQGPDLIGLWGSQKIRSGVNEEYLEYLIDQSVRSVALASESKQAATMSIAQDTASALILMQDTRRPYVINPTVTILQAKNLHTKKTIATMVNWGNHVETLWDQNLSLTSDFVHYLRKGITKGVSINEEEIIPAQGGVCLFMPGAVGGLMTTSPELSIRNPITNAIHTKPSFTKAEAQGLTLAKIAIAALQGDNATHFFHTKLKSYQQPIELPLDNNNFRLAAYLGLLDRGMTSWMKVRSEIGYWKFGPASFVHVPGELYPELFVGGVEEPKEADVKNKSLEIPPLESVMTGEYKSVIGLSNDMIGYILPRSQWDEAAPFTYGQQTAPYGEEMSLGPNTAPLIHATLLSLITRAEEQ